MSDSIRRSGNGVLRIFNARTTFRTDQGTTAGTPNSFTERTRCYARHDWDRAPQSLPTFNIFDDFVFLYDESPLQPIGYLTTSTVYFESRKLAHNPSTKRFLCSQHFRMVEPLSSRTRGFMAASNFYCAERILDSPHQPTSSQPRIQMGFSALISTSIIPL